MSITREPKCTTFLATGLTEHEFHTLPNEARNKQLAEARAKSLAKRRETPIEDRKRAKREKGAQEAKYLMLVDSKYTRSQVPVALNANGGIDIAAEIASFLTTKEGTRMLRRSIRAMVVKAMHGDTSMMKLLVQMAPKETNVNIKGLVGHLHKDMNNDEQAEHVLSPAELRQLEQEQKDE